MKKYFNYQNGIAFGFNYKTEKEKAKAIYKETSLYTLDNVCDACGKYPKQPNSMLCKECEVKAYDNSDS